jgi:hypothetical protein
MMTDRRTRIAASAAATVLAAAVAGSWIHSTQKTRAFTGEISVRVADTSERIGSSFGRIAGPAADGAGTVRRLDEHTAAVDGHRAALRALGAARNPGLADAADDYVLTAREILKRLADSERHHHALTDSLQHLREHMRAADRTGAWVTEAVRAREMMDRDYRHYSLAAQTLDTLLDAFPAAQSAIARHLGAGLLIDDGLVSEVRERTLAAARRAAGEVEKLRQLDAHR